MAYAAVVSLVQILKQLMFSDQISIPYPKSLIKSLYSNLCSLQALLEQNFPAQNNDQSRINELETQIRDAIYEAEDIIESNISNHFLSSEFETSWDLLQKSLQKLDSIKETSTDQINKRHDLITPLASSRSVPMVNTKLVGLKEGLSRLKDKLIGESSQLNVIAVVGMAGIGKTTLVNEVYQDPSIRQFFHYQVWASVGPNYDTRDILVALLRSYVRDVSKFNEETTYTQLTELMYRNLKGRRYLIVLDGLSDDKMWYDLKNLFPNDDNGSRIMLTTRLRKVAFNASGSMRNVHQMSFLDNDESWDLLRDIVFADTFCPHELSKIGKTIAENFQGLPLTIVLVGTVLSRAEKTKAYWEKVAESPISAIYDSSDASLISAMQFLNDENLPQHLKAFFLYMGVFSLNDEIAVSKLIKLWVAEGFVQQIEGKSLEEVAEACLEELVDRSLVLVHKPRSTCGIKTCSVHSAVWHLCVDAAEKEIFFRAVSRYTQNEASQQSTSTGRRLCIRKNILLSVKDVFNDIMSAPNVHSLICSGPNHPYPLPVCSDSIVLRVLDAITLRFYEFPLEILNLIQLRYLALTCNGDEIPASISKLWNLQVLIMRRHLGIIKSSNVPWYLSNEIWKMKYLRHLKFMGVDLPDPCGAYVLTNLLTLSNVTAHSCTQGVFSGTPNRKKLGIRIELAEDVASPSQVFDHLALLSQLESLKCIVVIPNHGSLVIAPPNSVSNFPSTLRKLTLGGCGFDWKDMKIIAELPNLEVLKLRCYAFHGRE